MTKDLMISRGGGRNAGMFSYVNQVISNLHVADLKNAELYVLMDDTPYKDPERGENCWDYYFLQPFGISPIQFGDYNIVQDGEWFPDHLVLGALLNPSIIGRANFLCKKYIKLQPSLEKKIQDFKRDVIVDSQYGAIHYRGTDHHYGTPNQTQPLLPQSLYMNYIDQLLTKFPKVLVCSDQADFIELSVNTFGSEKIVFYSSIRSTSHLAVHYNNAGAKYQTGEDVIIEAVLMAESSYLVRTVSNVTNFSIFYGGNDLPFKNIDDLSFYPY